MNTQLLCTFTSKEKLEETLQEIREVYFIVYNYIYVLQNKSDLDKLYVTFNIDTDKRPKSPLENTILVHRKKHFNTLYTINALNETIKNENDGELDKQFQLDWSKYKNSILVTNTEGVKKINTRIFKIIEFSN